MFSYKLVVDFGECLPYSLLRKLGLENVGKFSPFTVRNGRFGKGVGVKKEKAIGRFA